MKVLFIVIVISLIAITLGLAVLNLINWFRTTKQLKRNQKDEDPDIELILRAEFRFDTDEEYITRVDVIPWKLKSSKYNSYSKTELFMLGEQVVLTNFKKQKLLKNRNVCLLNLEILTEEQK